MTAKIEPWMIDAMKSLHCAEYYTDAMAERDARHIAAHAPKQETQKVRYTLKRYSLCQDRRGFAEIEPNDDGVLCYIDDADTVLAQYAAREHRLRDLAASWCVCTWGHYQNPGIELLAILNEASCPYNEVI